MERALLRFDGFFGDNVGGIPFGGNCVRGPSLHFWAGGGGSAFKVGNIVIPPASEKVLSKVSFREACLSETDFPEFMYSRKSAKDRSISVLLIPLAEPSLSGLRVDAQPSTCRLQVEGYS